ncbi:MAG: hypothetical protein ABFR89_11515 [Actinomycetota bacterium]
MTETQPAAMHLSWITGRNVFSGGGEGVVDGSSINAGASLSNGMLVATVRGEPRMAFVAEAPLFRPLAIGDEGPDVRLLAEFLESQGFLEREAADPAVVGRSMSDAIAAFNMSHGIERVRRNSRGRVIGPEFGPSLLLWIGPDTLAVASVSYEVGGMWPGVGQAVLVGAPNLVSAHVVPLMANEALGTSLDERYRFWLNDSTSFALAQDGGIEAADLREVEALVAPLTETVEGIARLANPRVLQKIPTSAVVLTGESTCVFSAIEGHDGFRQIAVQVVDSSFGETLIQGDVEGEHVLVNPSQVLDGPGCSS